jgi:hypothetical protein
MLMEQQLQQQRENEAFIKANGQKIMNSFLGEGGQYHPARMKAVLGLDADSWDTAFQRERGAQLTDEDEKIRLFWTHLYSYPFTVNAAQSAVGPTVTRRVVVLGAEVEAVGLPVNIWQCASQNKDADFFLDLVGPSLPAQLHDTSKQMANVTVSYSRRKFHENHTQQAQAQAQADTAMKPPVDMYVLFNSGCGHPKGQAHWQPTLERLFFSEPANVPVVFTCFHEKDLADDLAFIERLLEHNSTPRKLAVKLQAQRNPFASHRCNVEFDSDPQQGRLMAPNQFVFAVTAQ